MSQSIEEQYRLFFWSFDCHKKMDYFFFFDYSESFVEWTKFLMKLKIVKIHCPTKKNHTCNVVNAVLGKRAFAKPCIFLHPNPLSFKPIINSLWFFVVIF